MKALSEMINWSRNLYSDLDNFVNADYGYGWGRLSEEISTKSQERDRLLTYFERLHNSVGRRSLMMISVTMHWQGMDSEPRHWLEDWEE